MPVSAKFRNEMEALVGTALPIRSKAMFGGIAFYSDELLFAILDNDRIWFKTDASNKGDYEVLGMPQWVPYEGAKPGGYHELPPSILADVDKLREWAQTSMAIAAKKKKKS